MLRTTLDQVGTLRDAALEQARSGRDRLDAMRLDRQRRDALADLGEAVLARWRDGDLPDLAGHLDIEEIINEIEDMDREARAEAARARPGGGLRDGGRGGGRDSGGRGGGGGLRGRPGARDDDPEAVSSSSWRPPAPAREVRVWRPVMPDDEPAGEAARDDIGDAGGRGDAAHRRGQPASSGRRRLARRDGGGGIAFVSDDIAGDDDDLSDYMHEDDVPDGGEPSGS